MRDNSISLIEDVVISAALTGVSEACAGTARSILLVQEVAPAIVWQFQSPRGHYLTGSRAIEINVSALAKKHPFPSLDTRRLTRGEKRILIT